MRNKLFGGMVFSERIQDFGLRNVLALAALLLSAALVFTHTAGADPDPVFAPTVSLQTSTTRAAAHPDARITIDNSASTEAIKDITLDLPDGMMGSLNAADQCTVSQAQAESCPSTSKVGTVVNYAKVDNSDAVLRGSVYLTEALPPYDDDDPAGLQIVVPAKIGGVNMGQVVVNARVQMHYDDLNPGWGSAPTDAVGVIRGVRTIVNDVPKEITDDNNRTVAFSLTKLVVDLRSNQTAPKSKLLTNSSRCRTTQVFISATSYQSTEASHSEDYTTTQCEDVHVGDAEEMIFTTDNQAAGGNFAFTSSIEFPDDQPTLAEMKLQLPPSIGINAPGFGEPSDQCPVTNFDLGANGDQNNFSVAGCPSQAKVGTVTIETPLLPDPVVGELWFIEKSPIPIMGIFVSPSTGPNNPAGVQFGVVGDSGTPKLNSSCPSSPSPPLGGCKTGIAVTFINLPDVPVKKITVEVDGDPRPTGRDAFGDPVSPGDPSEVSLGKFVRNATASDPSCQPLSDVTADFGSWVGWDPDLQTTSKRGSGLATNTIGPSSPCTGFPVTMASSPLGGYAVANPPTLGYENAVVASAVCKVDSQVGMTNCNPVGGAGGSGTHTPGVPLAEGIRYFYVRSNNLTQVRAFGIPNAAPSDTTAPTVTLDTVPSDPTSDTTPTVEFSSDEDAYFQCSLDGEAYLPCDSLATAPASSGTYTVPNALIPNDTEHTIRVRAQDAAGNVSSVQPASFTVKVALDPTFDIFKPGTTTPGLSTEVARAHPEMDIVVTSGSHEDIKNLNLEMPNGLLGGLTAVPTICPIAAAQAGNCTTASQVGTVDTEAVVDESTVRLSGKVFMTSPIVAGDPAGLVIDVPAEIQDIDNGHVIVPIRLSVRGPKIGNAFTNIEGVSSVATNLPRSIDPAAWGNTFDTESEFDLRSMTLKLRNNPAASEPLLTNPSDCTPDNFAVSFEGYDGTDVTKSTSNINWTGCGDLGFAPAASMSIVDTDTGLAPAERTPSFVPNTKFTANVTMDAGGSSIKSASVLLPPNVSVEVGVMPAPCTNVVYEGGGAEACPASTKVGTVSAISPLLREPLTGAVHVLQGVDTLPRLLLALRGPINTDIVGSMSFVDPGGESKILTTFATSPDAPISSLSLSVNRVVITSDTACSFGADKMNATSTFNAYNNKSATSVSPLPVTCNGTGTARFSYKSRNRSTLGLAIKAPKGTTYKSVQIDLPKGITFLKRGFARGLSIKSGTSRLKATCGKSGKARRFTTALCNKPGRDISIRFGAGTLKSRRIKKPTFTVTAVDNLGRTHTIRLQSAK